MVRMSVGQVQKEVGESWELEGGVAYDKERVNDIRTFHQTSNGEDGDNQAKVVPQWIVSLEIRTGWGRKTHSCPASVLCVGERCKSRSSPG